ncbi:hypothetical protein BT96DRAFT_943515 [Gymnopus androsaceus JB14]|uniref:Uncharacterized protein n=1 Tax=Gymnopus androsaceus JB14 TaxID=1447944 RepID=A0A6A4H7A1_9AGAR|nr:hypothetical protein BT96DRAFT_943515 [Gymnopus androsaceus JB14]
MTQTSLTKETSLMSQTSWMLMSRLDRLLEGKDLDVLWQTWKKDTHCAHDSWCRLRPKDAETAQLWALSATSLTFSLAKAKNGSALVLTPLPSPSKREQNGFLSPPSQPLPSQSAPSLVGEQTILLPQPMPSPSIVDELIPTSQPILTIPPLLTPTIPDELIDPVLRGLLASDAMAHSAPPAGSCGLEVPGVPTQPPSPPSPGPLPTPSLDSPTQPLPNPLLNSPSQPQSTYHVFSFASQTDGVVEEAAVKKTKKRKIQPQKKAAKTSEVHVNGIGKENIPPFAIVLSTSVRAHNVVHPAQTPELAPDCIPQEHIQKVLGGPETINEHERRLGIGKYKVADNGEGIDERPAKHAKCTCISGTRPQIDRVFITIELFKCQQAQGRVLWEQSTGTGAELLTQAAVADNEWEVGNRQEAGSKPNGVIIDQMCKGTEQT